MLANCRLVSAERNARPRAGWTATTKPTDPRASWCWSIRSAVTSSTGSAKPSRPAPLMPRPIGIDEFQEILGAVTNFDPRR